MGEKKSFMTEKTFLICAILLFCAPSIIHAAGSGNSIYPVGKYKSSFSMEDNIIFNRETKARDESDAPSGSISGTKFTFKTVNQTYGKVVFGLTNAINIYAKLGASDVGTIKQEFEDGSTIDVTSNYGFLWGVGINGSKDIYKGLRLGLDLQYGGWQTTADGATYSGEKATNVSGQIRNQEYQATVYMTKKFSFVDTGIDYFPYLGCRLSDFRTKTIQTVKFTTTPGRIENGWNERNKNRLGLVLGADMFLPKYFFQLSVEGRFIDETAIATGVTYKY